MSQSGSIMSDLERADDTLPVVVSAYASAPHAHVRILGHAGPRDACPLGCQLPGAPGRIIITRAHLVVACDASWMRERPGAGRVQGGVGSRGDGGGDVSGIPLYGAALRNEAFPSRHKWPCKLYFRPTGYMSPSRAMQRSSARIMLGIFGTD